MKVTIIGVGNTARGDDGVAHRVLERLEAARCEGDLAPVTLLGVHQLDVSMAAALAAVDTVVFVDAERRAEPATEVKALDPGSTAPSVHAVDPAGLLGLVRSLYGTAPAAWLVSVAGPSMEHLEGLSLEAEAASAEAASVIRALLAEHGEVSGVV